MREKELSALRSNDFGFIFQQLHLVSTLTLFENIVVSGIFKQKLLQEKTCENMPKNYLKKWGFNI